MVNVGLVCVIGLVAIDERGGLFEMRCLTLHQVAKLKIKKCIVS